MSKGMLSTTELGKIGAGSFAGSKQSLAALQGRLDDHLSGAQEGCYLSKTALMGTPLKTVVRGKCLVLLLFIVSKI